MKHKLKIGLVYDLRTDYLAEGFSEKDVAEFDSPVTLQSLEDTLTALGYAPERIGHARALCRRLVQGHRWDLVFTIAEGVSGRSREAQVPALLELYGIPYTFSDPLTCAVTLDKSITKRLIEHAGLRTPRHALVESARDLRTVNLRFPLFVKPVAEGTGKGVDARSRVNSRRELTARCKALLRLHRQPVLVEEYLPGREFTTGILGTGPDARVLGTMEVMIKPNAPAQDYSYEVKELCEQFVDYRPMPAGPLRRQLEALALAAHRCLQCRDTSRVDIRLDTARRPSFMELNPLPGLHPTHSDLPLIATQEGMSYRQLIAAIVRSALTRTGAPRKR